MSANQAIHDVCSLVSYMDAARVTPGLLAAGSSFYSPVLAGATTSREACEALLKSVAETGVGRIANGKLSIAPKVIATQRASMSDEAKLAWSNAAFRTLERIMESNRSDTTGLQQLAPHLMALSEHAPAAKLPPYPLSTVLYRAGLSLHEAQQTDHALPLLVRAVKATLASGDKDHPVVATRINTLGICYQESGDLPNARRCFEQALGICERVFGPTEEAVYRVDDERLLTLPLRNLCRVLLQLNDLESVQRTYDRALNVYVQVHGHEHPLVAECANDMGQVWLEMGHLDRATLHFETAVEIEEQTAQPMRGHLAAYLVNLGTVTLAAGQHAEAEQLFRRALTLDERDYGRQSIEYARDLAALGEALRKDKRLSEAMEALQTASQIFDDAGQAPDPIQLRLLSSSMGKIAHASKDYESAVEHFSRALGLVRSAEPENRFALAREYAHLSRAQLFDGQVDLAGAAAEKGLLVLTVSTDPRAAELRGTLLSQFGEVLEAQGDFAAAREHYDKALQSDEVNLGAEHPNVARDLARIGTLLGKEGDAVSAIAHLNRAQSMLTEAFGPDHSRVRRIRAKIARVSSG